MPGALEDRQPRLELDDALGGRRGAAVPDADVRVVGVAHEPIRPTHLSDDWVANVARHLGIDATALGAGTFQSP